MRHEPSPSPVSIVGEQAREAPCAISSTGDAGAASSSRCPQLIDLDVCARNKHELFTFAARMLQRDHGVDPAPILRALWRREVAGSTGLGKGVAIPHARVPGIPEPLTMLLRLQVPIPFEAPDGEPVSLALVIIVPADDATDQHLQLLARFASLCAGRGFRTKLLEATDAEDVCSAFIETSLATD